MGVADRKAHQGVRNENCSTNLTTGLWWPIKLPICCCVFQSHNMTLQSIPQLQHQACTGVSMGSDLSECVARKVSRGTASAVPEHRGGVMGKLDGGDGSALVSRPLVQLDSVVQVPHDQLTTQVARDCGVMERPVKPLCQAKIATPAEALDAPSMQPSEEKSRERAPPLSGSSMCTESSRHWRHWPGQQAHARGARRT